MHSVTSLVGLLAAVEHDSAVSVCFQFGLSSDDASVVHGSVQIVPVKICGHVVDLGPERIARRSLLGSIELGVEVVVALVGFEVVQQTWGDDVEPSHSLGEAGLHIEVPVGGTVSDHKALKVHLDGGGV